MHLGIALYNALRSIDVSDEKALEVVNAMESEMHKLTDNLATKQDLAQLESRLTLRFGAMLAVGIAFLTAIKFFG